MNVKIIHSQSVNVTSLGVMHRYDLLFDEKMICHAAYEHEVPLVDLLLKFENYLMRNTSLLKNNKVYTKLPDVFKPETIFNKEMPELELMIKQLIVKKNLRDIEKDFV